MTHQDDSILARELPLIHRIIQDETWLEGERRGRPVAPSDPVVRENVCRVILRIGQQMRDSLMKADEAARSDRRADFDEVSSSGLAA